MKIATKDIKAVELSYHEAINLIKKDIQTDDSMPKSVKNSALYLSHMLETVLLPYSD